MNERVIIATTEKRSMFQSILRRCARAGIRFVVTAPADTQTFVAGIRRFSNRVIDPTEHACWNVAFRRFRAIDYAERGVQLNGARDFPHDPGSWRILATRDRDEVIGAITMRIFCGRVVRDYLYDLTLLAACSIEGRGDYEAAFENFVAATAASGQVLVEVSNWAVASTWRDSGVGVCLVLMQAALTREFVPYQNIASANYDTGAYGMIEKFGGKPVAREGRVLPPFYHPVYKARLGLLSWTAADYHARFQPTTDDLTAFSRECRMVSAV